MFCPKCGYDNDFNVKICQFCGYEFNPTMPNENNITFDKAQIESNDINTENDNLEFKNDFYPSLKSNVNNTNSDKVKEENVNHNFNTAEEDNTNKYTFNINEDKTQKENHDTFHNRVKDYFKQNFDCFPEEKIPFLVSTASSLTSDQFDIVSLKPLKKPGLTFGLSFLGVYGVDRFYLGQVGLGLLKFFTAGGFWVWWIIDIFRAYKNARKENFNRFIKYMESVSLYC